MLGTIKNLNQHFFDLDLSKNNIKKCKNCFLPEGLYIQDDIFLASNSLVNVKKTILNENCICNFCLDYKNKLNLGILEKEKDLLFLENNKSLLLFSGGKDSIWTFIKLINLGVKFDGLLYDNGYINEDIINNSKKLFKKFNKRLFIERNKIDIVPQETCINCSKNLNSYINMYKKKYLYNLLISGNNYTVYEKEGFLSSYKIINGVINLNLPFLYQNTYSNLIKTLKSNNYQKLINFDIRGNSTNCLAIGLEIEKESNINKSFLSELVYLSLEKRFKFYSRKKIISKGINEFKNFSNYFLV